MWKSRGVCLTSRSSACSHTVHARLSAEGHGPMEPQHPKAGTEVGAERAAPSGLGSSPGRPRPNCRAPVPLRSPQSPTEVSEATAVSSHPARPGRSCAPPGPWTYSGHCEGRLPCAGHWPSCPADHRTQADAHQAQLQGQPLTGDPGPVRGPLGIQPTGEAGGRGRAEPQEQGGRTENGRWTGHAALATEGPGKPQIPQVSPAPSWSGKGRMGGPSRPYKQAGLERGASPRDPPAQTQADHSVTNAWQ